VSESDWPGSERQDGIQGKPESEKKVREGNEKKGHLKKDEEA